MAKNQDELLRAVEPVDRWIDAKDAAKIIGCTPKHVRDMAHLRKLPFKNIGTGSRMRMKFPPPAEIRRWMREGSEPPARRKEG